MKLLITLLTVVSLCAFGQSSNRSSGPKKTELLWDNYGVPHIYGRTVDEMYYGFGYAQMHNHANLLLRLYGQARGKAAEYWGSEYLDSDKIVTMFNVPERVQKQYGQQDLEYRNCLNSFVKGINAYAKAHPEAIGAEFRQVLPITSQDVLAHSLRVICLEFIGGGEAGAARVMPPGSNAYAIAPSKSASKKAMLMANPHLPWENFFLFFEAHLNAPGFMAYGASLVGQPVLNIAFNNHLGWTHTVNTIDAADRYLLTLQDDGYVLDGVKQPFEKKPITFKIRQPDGQLREQTITFRYSKHGPVMESKDGKPYAFRFAGLDSASPAQHHYMAKAKNYQEFETAVRKLQLPMFNIIYADQAGNILYLFNGSVPKRSEGDWPFWQGAVDGTASKYIWTETHPYQDLPKVFNPPSGFVQNANDTPWTCTYPIALDPKQFAPYMSPLIPLRLRPQRSINLIKDDASITFEELVGYKLNTGMEAADRFLDDLLAAVEKHPDTLAVQAVTVLKGWDKATNVDSKGAVLFAAWFDQFNPGMTAVPWDRQHPVTTPDGLKNPQQAVTMLVKAAQQVRQRYGRLDVAWGDVNRFTFNGQDFPGNGGSEQYGIYRTIYFSPEGRDAKQNRAVAGDSYVAVTEFGDKVRAQVSLSYGNASQPGNKHVADQFNLLSEKKLRPALLDKQDILKNLEEKEELSMESGQ
ncbi:acylase [Fibrisoma montanum]|uniref:Acylase n=1 Tax=Fibrisoma montanum TaxID=2305895 RepID=A0A418M8L9_9BACT|nr:acylase [Fibrisoma montanum]RIV22441.1 acylase [Fibrisoma montanum]